MESKVYNASSLNDMGEKTPQKNNILGRRPINDSEIILCGVLNHYANEKKINETKIKAWRYWGFWA